MRKTRMHCPECSHLVTQEVRPNAHNGMRYYPVGHKLNPTEEEIHSFDRMRLCNYCLEEYRTVEMSSKQLRKILEALKNVKSDLEKSKRESGRLRHQLTEVRLLAQKIGAIGHTNSIPIDTLEMIHAAWTCRRKTGDSFATN